MSTISNTTDLEYIVFYLDGNHQIIDSDTAKTWSKAVQMLKASQQMDINNLLGISDDLATVEQVKKNETPCPVCIVKSNELAKYESLSDLIACQGSYDMTDNWII